MAMLNQRYSDIMETLQTMCAEDKEQYFSGWQVLERMRLIFPERYAKVYGWRSEAGISRSMGILYNKEMTARRLYCYKNQPAHTFYCYRIKI